MSHSGPSIAGWQERGYADEEIALPSHDGLAGIALGRIRAGSADLIRPTTWQWGLNLVPMLNAWIGHGPVAQEPGDIRHVRCAQSHTQVAFQQSTFTTEVLKSGSDNGCTPSTRGCVRRDQFRFISIAITAADNVSAARQSAPSMRRSAADDVTGVTIPTTKALRGSSLAQVCDERATFFPHGNATFMA